MKKYVIITADTNDGDYVTEKTSIDDSWVEKYSNLINSIRNNSGSWTTGEMQHMPLYEQYPDYDESKLEKFDQYVPRGEYGVHTIESIEILVVAEETKLL